MTSRKSSKLKGLIVSAALCLALGLALIVVPRLLAQAPAAPAGVPEITAQAALPATEAAAGEAIRLPWGPDAETSLWIVLFAAILALAFGYYWWKKTMAQNPGSERMQGVASAVQEGAMAYLKPSRGPRGPSRV